MPLTVSVIATVLNEAEALPRLLDSLCQQTRMPDEVIICDGGSDDGTPDVLAHYTNRLPLRVIHLPGANISRGRNAAIAAASSEIIASTDAGVRLSPNWLEMIVAPFEQVAQEAEDLRQLRESLHDVPGFPWDAEPVQVVAGFFEPDPQSAFEMALGATTLPGLEDINPVTFLPSSRSLAFRKSAWQQAGGYPEWLDYCEDLIFDFKLRRQTEREGWVFEPNALAHFRPRSSLAAFFRQYYRYARGDGKADLWRKRHAIRYGVYFLSLPLMVLAGLRGRRAAWALLLTGMAGYLRTPYRRLLPRLPALRPAERVQALLWVPAIRAIGDVAKMLGYPAGLWWRWRERGGHGWQDDA